MITVEQKTPGGELKFLRLLQVTRLDDAPHGDGSVFSLATFEISLPVLVNEDA